MEEIEDYSSIKMHLDVVLANVEYAIKRIEGNKLTNEQFVLNWFDKLNKLSVKH